jgi:hypothetical protein
MKKRRKPVKSHKGLETKAELLQAIKPLPTAEVANNPVCQALLAEKMDICGRALNLFCSHETAASLPSSLLPPPL